MIFVFVFGIEADERDADPPAVVGRDHVKHVRGDAVPADGRPVPVGALRYGGQPESPDVVGVPDQRRSDGNVRRRRRIELISIPVTVRDISLRGRAEFSRVLSIRVRVSRLGVVAAVPDHRQRDDELAGRGAALRPASQRRSSGQRGQSPDADADRHDSDKQVCACTTVSCRHPAT